MLDERDTQIANAVATLTENDFTATGAPRLHALNIALEIAAHEPLLSSEARDAAWGRIVAAMEAPPEPEPEPAAEVHRGFVWVRVTQAEANPVSIYVHGLGRYTMRVAGNAVRVPRDVAKALRNTNVQFTETEDE